MSELDNISELGKKPLPEGTEDFSEIMYDEQYEALADIFSPSNFEERNWQYIAELAKTVFTEKTKHIRVLQWLCEALINTQGFAGLNCALNILKDLAADEAIWGMVDPIKAAKKAQAIRTFEENILPWIKALEVTEADSETIKSSLIKIKEIKQALANRFQNESDEEEPVVSPGLRDLQELLASNDLNTDNASASIDSSATSTTSSSSIGSSATAIKNTGSQEPLQVKEFSKINSSKEAEITGVTLARQVSLADGLDQLQQGYSQADSIREKFFWTLAQVHLLYSNSNVELAIFHLEILEKNIEQYKLEEWEPQISIDVAELFLKCCDMDEKQKKTSAREKAYKRLCRLDMARSLQF